MAGQEFIEDDAQRVDVAAAGEGLALGHFRRGVVQRFIFRAVNARPGGVAHDGHAKVDQDRRAVLAQHDIFRPQVVMD